MPEMHVTVRLSGSLAARLGSRVAVELEPGARVADLLAALALDEELDDRASDALAVVCGGTIVTRARVLADGDEIDVLVPVAGG